MSSRKIKLPSRETIAIIRTLVDKIRNDFYQLNLNKNVFDELTKGVTGLGRLSDYAESKVTKPTRYPHTIPYKYDNFGNLIENEILKLNQSGWTSITSCSECFLKIQSLINAYQKDDGDRTITLFRGQQDESFGITSSIARKMKKTGVSLETTEVSQFELDALAIWQRKIYGDIDLKIDVFGDADVYSPNDARWWQLKQHYDDDKDTGGSRLIDVTSSPLAALYFACADWDGKIDESVDGMLWAFMYAPGVQFIEARDLPYIDPIYHDFYAKAGNEITNYFNFEDLENVHTILSSPVNHRSIAQDGYFLYYSDLSKEGKFERCPIFTFLIPKEAKKSILRELYSLGYSPEKMVQGKKGVHAKKIFEKQLGIVHAK